MDLDALRLFVSVATHESFSRAASEHGLHRTAVSRRIAALEEALGTDLLIRTTRRVGPTTAGRLLLEEASPLLERLTSALARVPETSSQPAGTLRLSAPQDVGMWLLPSVLGGLAERHPAVKPLVELSNRLVDIGGEGFDAALRLSRSSLSGAGIRARRIGTVRVGVYAAPSYIERNGAPDSLDALDQHALVGLSEVVPDVVGGVAEFVAAGDMLLAAALAQKGAGVAFLPTFVATRPVAAGELVRLLADQDVVVAGLYLVFADSPRVPLKVLAFRDEVLRFINANPLT